MSNEQQGEAPEPQNASGKPLFPDSITMVACNQCFDAMPWPLRCGHDHVEIYSREYTRSRAGAAPADEYEKGFAEGGAFAVAAIRDNLGHLRYVFDGIECCKWCALVWPADGWKKWCKGPHELSLRATATSSAAQSELIVPGNRDAAIRLLRELRETTDPDEIRRQKDSWAQLSADLHGEDSVLAAQSESCAVSVTGKHRVDPPYCKDCGQTFAAASEGEQE